MTIKFYFANNDSRGNQTTRATALFIGEMPGIHLEASNGVGVFCYHRFADSKLKVARIATPGKRFQSWAGNMAWNACEIDIAVATKLVNYLRRRGNWTIAEAPEGFFRKWETGEVFVDADLAECVK